jgi:hypothetical protein
MGISATEIRLPRGKCGHNRGFRHRETGIAASHLQSGSPIVGGNSGTMMRPFMQRPLREFIFINAIECFQRGRNAQPQLPMGGKVKVKK